MKQVRVHPLAFSVLTFIVGIGLGISYNSPAHQASQHKTATNVPCDRPEINKDNLMIKLNEHRLGQGKKQFARLPALDEYAQLRADEMAANKAVTHETKYVNWQEWEVANHKNEWTYMDKVDAEVIYGTVATSNPCEIILNWSNSPTHDDAISAFDDDRGVMGIGINGRYIAVEMAHEKPL